MTSTLPPDRARLVLEEYNRRTRQHRILDDAFFEQRAFLDDRCTLKAALCTRRAGKSYAIGLALFDAALRTPGVSCLYVALTRESAKKTMHKDVLRVISDKFRIGATFNQTTLDVTLPNGSVIYLLGADASKEESDKILGQKYALAVVDEAASFRQDLQHLCMDIILPTLADLDGQLLLIGTPGNVKNWFYEITSNQVPGWSVHRWTAHNNPHIKWAAFLAKLIEANPKVQETPQFKQHYLGQWVVDTSNLVYPGFSEACEITDAPDLDRSWSFILGVDLGHSPDPTSIVLGAYSDLDTTLYLLRAKSRWKLDFTDVADWIKEYQARYPIHAVIIDGASKQGVETMRRRNDLILETADKRGKAEAQAMMSSDFTLGRIKVLMPQCEDLVVELNGLVWDARLKERTGKFAEDPGCPNHCFVAGTMVATPSGESAIEDIRVGDLVLTRKGPRMVTSVSCTGIRPIWRLEADNGAVLLGTGEHPIWADGAWVPLCELTPGSTLGARCSAPKWPTTDEVCECDTTGSLTADTPMQTTTIIASIGVVTLTCLAVDTCTESYGKNTMGKKSPRGTISTIRTRTLSTMRSIISKRCQGPITSACTGGKTGTIPSSESGYREDSTLLVWSHHSGIEAPPAWRGMLSTAETFGRTVSRWISYVKCVARGFSLSFRQPRFAAATATIRSEWPLASTMRLEPAPSVERITVATSTSNKSVAPSRVQRISRTGIDAPVYNLSVEGEPEFFANDILVHNCSDGALYLWRKATNYRPTKQAALPVNFRPQSEGELERYHDHQIVTSRKKDVEWWERD